MDATPHKLAKAASLRSEARLVVTLSLSPDFFPEAGRGTGGFSLLRGEQGGEIGRAEGVGGRSIVAEGRFDLIRLPSPGFEPL